MLKCSVLFARHLEKLSSRDRYVVQNKEKKKKTPRVWIFLPNVGIFMLYAKVKARKLP